MPYARVTSWSKSLWMRRFESGYALADFCSFIYKKNGVVDKEYFV